LRNCKRYFLYFSGYRDLLSNDLNILLHFRALVLRQFTFFIILGMEVPTLTTIDIIIGTTHF
jgi:hypothetical protein